MKKMALGLKYSIILILAWVLAGNVAAQSGITAFIDAGEHNASGGFYLKPSLLGATHITMDALVDGNEQAGYLKLSIQPARIDYEFVQL